MKASTSCSAWAMTVRHLGQPLGCNKGAHAFNQVLADAYDLRNDNASGPAITHPTPDVVKLAKKQMLRLHLGPYQYLRSTTVKLASDQFLGSEAIQPGSTIVQKTGGQSSAGQGLIGLTSRHLTRIMHEARSLRTRNHGESTTCW